MADFDRIYITGVPVEVKKELVNIAKKKGITISSFLKSKLRDIIEAETKRVFPKG
jgi:post-segregation antitoxin (ccd killing protein)